MRQLHLCVPEAHHTYKKDLSVSRHPQTPLSTFREGNSPSKNSGEGGLAFSKLEGCCVSELWEHEEEAEQSREAPVMGLSTVMWNCSFFILPIFIHFRIQRGGYSPQTQV